MAQEALETPPDRRSRAQVTGNAASGGGPVFVRKRHAMALRHRARPSGLTHVTGLPLPQTATRSEIAGMVPTSTLVDRTRRQGPHGAALHTD